MRHASTRTPRSFFQRLCALGVVPYLLLAVFGEGLHSHPLLPLSQTASATQSASTQSASPTRGAHGSSAPSQLARTHQSAESAAECAACLWQSHSTAQAVVEAPLPALPLRTALRPADAATLASLSPLVSRNRGPPLH